MVKYSVKEFKSILNIFCYCKVCEVRKCGQGKNLKNCACCADYACEELNKLFAMVPEAKTTLEEIRKSL